MSIRFLFTGIAVCAMGALGLVTSVQASTPAMFGCPFSECVTNCPGDILDFCHTHGCDTVEDRTNCGELFNCSGPDKKLVYCGSNPET